MGHFSVWTDLNDNSILMRSATHEQLVRLSPYTGEIIPGLAEGWTITPGDTGVTFFFPDGRTWHNGELFSCGDALFSVETMWKGPELGRLPVSSMAPRFAHIESVECIDAASRETQALKVTFSRPIDNPLNAFAQPGPFIFQKAWFQGADPDAEPIMLTDMSVGTGPWVWSGDPVGKGVQRFVKNPEYQFADAPYADSLSIQGEPNPLIARIIMEEHELSWQWVGNQDQYDAYVANDRIITAIRDGQSAAYWAELEGYVHFTSPAIFGAFDHVWIDPARFGHPGFSGQTAGQPGSE